MTPTEPTPTPGDAPRPLTGEQALGNAIWHAVQSLPLGTVTDAIPGIVTDLRAHGFTITPPEAGNNSILPQGLTWHECECCRTIFIADTDDDHLWAMEGCRVLCSTCYVAETHELVHQHLLEKYAKEKSNEPNQPPSDPDNPSAGGD